jgi:hypothetical protein
MVVLCLIAALCGTPLRQSEAADDFSRAQEELAGGHTLDSVDGGVGDDSGETVLKAQAILVMPPTAGGNPIELSLSGCLPFDRYRHDLASIPEPSSRRQARLQCFLF